MRKREKVRVVEGEGVEMWGGKMECARLGKMREEEVVMLWGGVETARVWILSWQQSGCTS